MLAAHWSAAAAGAVGLALALALALAVFDIGAEVGLGPGPALLGAGAEALHNAATILWIIFPALALHEFQRRTGAVDRIRATLAGLTEDRRLQALLIAWFFALFAEGAAGFGTPVALAAPLLVGLGFAPVRAVALALLGHAAGVSFGAVGTPVLAQAELTGIPARDIAAGAALMHALLGWILLVALMRLAADGESRGPVFGWTLLAGAAFFAPSLVLATLAGPELATLGGALVGAFVFAGFLWPRRPSGAAPVQAGALLRDLAPYLLVLALVLVTRLVGPVQEAAQGVVLGWSLHDAFRATFQPLYHPGTMLLAGLVAGALATGRVGAVGPAMAAAARRLLLVAVALAAMLALSRVMVHGGMIAALAGEAARTGRAWPLIAPAIGVLGTFVTGSATASNILFSDLQLRAAAEIGLPPAAMAAGQSFGAAVGNVLAPHNVIAGSATVGLQNREGEVLALTIAPGLLYAAAGGGLLYAFVSLTH
jgi:lactate permease